MARLIIENLTMEQAVTFANWYEGQGEQDADIWFECKDVKTPMSDVGRKNGCIEIDKKNRKVTLYCK